MEKELYEELKSFLRERKCEITKEAVKQNNADIMSSIKHSFGRIVCHSHLDTVTEYEKRGKGFCSFVEDVVKYGKTIILDAESITNNIQVELGAEIDNDAIDFLSEILIRETNIFLQKVREIYEREKINGNL